MKLKKTFTGIALSLCVAMSSISPVYVAAADQSVKASDVLAEVKATSNYVKDKWGTESADIYSYRELILMMQSGIDCGKQYDNYMKTVSDNLTSDGKIVIDGSESAAIYAAVIDILTIKGENAANYQGKDLLTAFNNYLAQYKTAEELNTAISNPYYYSYVIPTVYSFASEMTDSTAILSTLKDAVLLNYIKNDSGCGIDYYGFSADTNGKVLSVLSYYYKDDTDLSTKIDDAINWTLSLKLDNKGYKFDNNSWSVDANASSTAMALSLMSSYSKDDEALNAYNSLLTYKSSAAAGAYTYMDKDSMFSTDDALEGLITYYRYLTNAAASPYDVTGCKPAPVIQITLTFNCNGGTYNRLASYSKKILKYAPIKSLCSKSPIRSGYAFKGWYTRKSGGTKITASSSFEGNTTIYAQWTKVAVKKAAIKKINSTSKKALLTLNNTSGANGYVIVYSTSQAFKGAKKVTANKTYTVINNLKSGKKYYFKARAYKKDSAGKKIYGNYSSVRSITIK